MTQSPQILLHWYASSPFSQKVLWALLYKKVEFKTVTCSPVEPRPLRRPLDGGYRKTPFLQIGNHSYCDSKVIFAELERRYPEPSFYPVGPQGESTEALAQGLGRWTDNLLFMSVASQIPLDMVDDEFLKDRSEFSGRPLKRDFMKFTQPHLKQSLISEFQLLQTFVTERNNKGETFALGTKQLSLVDFHVAMLTWFVGMTAGPKFVPTYVPQLGEHLQKVLETVDYNKADDIEDLDPEDALEVAKKQTWKLQKPEHDGHLKAKLGSMVTVAPTDTGIVPVFGTLVSTTLNETVIEITDDEHKITTFVHFPVLGFLVLPMPGDSKL